ncbi:hypothetical protein F442_09298 [Phytophthora nicotianae P10297]|uniref:Elicitin n=6 Tax=Phytophthora nicotianae TaxID=4792 RepID=W2ZD12_PHYNI|nr:hypothetical protein L915_09196 [Phytophthora nicotianae]ETO74892.1 hypothetical protein F444_09462 [Phytophthora nicotianae P1976]ETP44084.1 hypothetical protein F442_09298 [Phytophthora nicotianae P10297]KUG02127.1 Elicitin protein SOL13F [Phytophthora nicotianae]ETL39576.1 hypothetical protein L916_09109 [Phytophthora nicotianae]
MKISVLFLTFIIAASSSMFAHAAECTEDDFITISEVYRQATADGTASCPDLTAAPDAADYCSYTECLRYMTSMLDDLPDCTSAGVSIKEGLQAAIDICDGGTTDMSDIVTASSSSTDSTPTTDTSSSSTSATNTASSSSAVQPTVSPSDSTTSDKITADAASGSSSASSISLAIPGVGVAMMAVIFAIGM